MLCQPASSRHLTSLAPSFDPTNILPTLWWLVQMSCGTTRSSRLQHRVFVPSPCCPYPCLLQLSSIQLQPVTSQALTDWRVNLRLVHRHDKWPPLVHISRPSDKTDVPRDFRKSTHCVPGFRSYLATAKRNRGKEVEEYGRLLTGLCFTWQD